MEQEEQRTTIHKCIDILAECAGKRPDGWLSPVLAFTPDTIDFLASAKLKWHADVTYTDLPHRIHTKYGPMAAVPNSDFTDNRVLKSNTLGLFNVHKSTFDYLYRNEPMSLQVVTMHCQFGGRPMVITAFEQIIRYMQQFPDVWFARHTELADWALQAKVDEHTYAARYFA